MTMPNLDPDLLLAHLEYTAWAAKKTITMVDKLPAEVVTAPVESSFPSILATLQHLYQGDKYDFIHLQGGSVGVGEVTPPATYAELRQEWPRLHAEMLAWAKENLAACKDVVLSGWSISRPAWMVVMQMANHATHHLGQVVTLARQAGYRPERSDFTDLILYYLQRYPQQHASAI
jgi:uncharacterized damage-inducible protein DinB